MIRIIVAEDHVVVRGGIVDLLGSQEDFELVGEAENGVQALRLIEGGLFADIVLTDLNMPEMDGIALTQQLSASYPALGVIILTMHNKLIYITNAFQAGARGYLLKSGDTKEIFKAIRQVHAGEIYYGSGVSMYTA